MASSPSSTGTSTPTQSVASDTTAGGEPRTAVFDVDLGSRMHMMHANLRVQGFPGDLLHITFGNDTGSAMPTITPADYAQLPQENRVPDVVLYSAASGGPGGGGRDGDGENNGIRCIAFRAELQITTADPEQAPLTPWFEEIVAVCDSALGRLSGQRMRDHLFFATGPGSEHLYVATTLDALMGVLP